MELKVKVVRRCTDWVLFSRDNGQHYLLYRLDGLNWKFFKEIFAGNVAEAIERATDITLWKNPVLKPNCAR